MRPLFVILAIFVFAACSETPVAPEAVGPSETPSFNFVNNPDNGNPRIYRFEDVQWGFLVYDPRTDLFAIHQTAGFSYFGCITPPAFYGFFDEQAIVLEGTYPPRVIDLVLGDDLYIAVFEGGSQWDGSCSDLFARMLAEGSGRLTITDNDYYAPYRENTNANAFGLVAQGQLEWVGGGRAHYNAVSKCVWDGEDPNTMRCVDRINLR